MQLLQVDRIGKESKEVLALSNFGKRSFLAYDFWIAMAVAQRKAGAEKERRAGALKAIAGRHKEKPPDGGFFGLSVFVKNC